MIKIKMTTESLANIKYNRELPKELTNTFRKTAYQMGDTLYKWLLADMKKPKSGRTYKSYFGVGGKFKNPKLVKASAPSETPAIRSGMFRKSVNFIVRGNKTLEWGSGKDNLATDYASALEFGTKKMQARQPLQRSMQANDGKIKALTNSNIKRVLNVR
jgi:hypothetical protein